MVRGRSPPTFDLKGTPTTILLSAASPPVRQAPTQETRPDPFFRWTGAHGGDSASGELRFAEARPEGDRSIIPGTIRIVTSKRGVYLGPQRGATDPAHYFTIEMPRRPDPGHPQWSDWRNFAPDPETPAETGPEGFAVRYRIIFAPEA